MSIRLTGSHGTWVLPDGETLFGRSTSCGICILDPRLSRRHVGFRVHGGQLTVVDLGSTNGVLVNGRPILSGGNAKHGDQVVIGPCLLTVRIDTQVAPAAVMSIASYGLNEQRQSEARTTVTPKRGDGSPGRQINPLIAAAVTPSDGRHTEDSDTHNPSDYQEPCTRAVTPRAKPPSGNSLIAPEERAAMLQVVHEFAATVHDEPAPPGLLTSTREAAPTRPSRGLRLAAGLLDAVQTTMISLVISAPIAVVGYALALRQAGAGLRDGLPTLASNTPATFASLTGSLLHDGGLAHALHMVGPLQNHFDRAPFLTLYLAVTVSLLAFLLTHLLSTVVATVLRGGPFWHRWLGLSIVHLATNAPPSWGLALRRWSLLLVLWPEAGVALARGRDGLHDRWSGCAVRRPASH